VEVVHPARDAEAHVQQKRERERRGLVPDDRGRVDDAVQGGVHDVLQEVHRRVVLVDAVRLDHILVVHIPTTRKRQRRESGVNDKVVQRERANHHNGCGGDALEDLGLGVEVERITVVDDSVVMHTRGDGADDDGVSRCVLPNDNST
jgi:hypothetical protein